MIQTLNSNIDLEVFLDPDLGGLLRMTIVYDDNTAHMDAILNFEETLRLFHALGDILVRSNDPDH